jgi:hypothetical protein
MKSSRTVVFTILAVVIVLGAAAVFVTSVVRIAWQRAHRLDKAQAQVVPQYDEEAAIKEAQTIAPDMIGYRETAGFSVSFHEPRAIAVDDEDRIYVGGDQGVSVFSPDGKKFSEIALKSEPRCLTVAGPQHGKPGQLYVGMEDHVDVYDAKGEHVGTWPSRGKDAFFTSITTVDYEVWVADAGNRLVWRFDEFGKLLTPIGKSSAGGGEFVVPNHYFDLAAAPDSLVYVVNPRLLRVEGYDPQRGERETTWGKGSPAVSDFFGCCNPAHLAVLPEGGFVTAEKGIPRVKIYTRKGEFKTVVAGPPQLSDTPAGVAGDHRGRVLVLDAKAAKVRVFEKKRSLEEKP